MHARRPPIRPPDDPGRYPYLIDVPGDERVTSAQVAIGLPKQVGAKDCLRRRQAARYQICTLLLSEADDLKPDDLEPVELYEFHPSHG